MMECTFIWSTSPVNLPDKGIPLKQTSFSIFQRFLGAVRNTFVLLADGKGPESPRSKLTLEFLCSELYSGLPKLIKGDLGPRPEHFPKRFLRMWLSNVPDYTGSIMSNIVYLSPYLEESKLALMSWNCLLNTSIFKTQNDLCFNYTSLTAADIKRILNVCIHNEDTSSFNDSHLSRVQHNPAKLFSTSVSKKQLLDYLHTLLLRQICCPKSPAPPYRVDEPTNLVAFFNFLIHLCRTDGPGYPSHWVGDFVQSLVDDKVFTYVMQYTGFLPINAIKAPKHVSKPRQVNMAPWKLELENILVTAKAAFPFHVSVPPSFTPSNDSIQTYTTRVIDTTGGYGNVNHAVMAAMLAFYKPSPKFSVTKFPSQLARLAEKGDSTFEGVEIQLLSSQEAMNFDTGHLVWRMSRAWYEKMQAEGWRMFVYVTNEHVTVSQPIEASRWKECPGHAASLIET